MNKKEVLNTIIKFENKYVPHRYIKNWDLRFQKLLNDKKIENCPNNRIECYKFLTGKNEKCKYGHILEFQNFKNGFKSCEKCKIKLINKTKQDKKKLYNFLKKDQNFITKSDKTLYLYIEKYNLNNFFGNVELTKKGIYDFLNGKTICKFSKCQNEPKFYGFSFGYIKFCSNECRQKQSSIDRTGDGNTIHRMTDEKRKKWKENLSKAAKRNIASGKWTPNVTNSWCHSKINLKIKNKIIPVRSSFEALFFIKNQNLEYEKLRVPYFFNNKAHSYIVDFIDYKNKKVYEVKPISNKKILRNIIKKESLIKWCKNNDFKYFEIDENWIHDNYDEDLIKDQPMFEDLKRKLSKI